MNHLSSEQFVDLAEGVAVPAAAAHLERCERCREQLADVKAALAAASAAREAIPEPSPMFWEHFSGRVRQAVMAEPAPVAPWWRFMAGWPAAVATAAVLVLAVTLGLRTPTNTPTVVPGGSDQAADMAGPAVNAEDPSLDLLVDLASGVDWDVADTELGSVTIPTEQTFSELNAAERSELHRLLSEALGGSGV